MDIEGGRFPDQLQARFHGYYIGPSRLLADSGHAFASGLMLVSCIDALALIESGNDKVGERFKGWCRENLPNFGKKRIQDKFYEDFRNGLVHEGRIKNGGEFNLEPRRTITDNPPILSINPMYLAEEVSAALVRLAGKLQTGGALRDSVNIRIVDFFKFEREK